jgi:hypothetical protein
MSVDQENIQALGNMDDLRRSADNKLPDTCHQLHRWPQPPCISLS